MMDMCQCDTEMIQWGGILSALETKNGYPNRQALCKERPKKTCTVGSTEKKSFQILSTEKNSKMDITHTLVHVSYCGARHPASVLGDMTY